MGSLLKYASTVLKLIIFFSLTSLIACNDKNEDPYAYISASVQGSNNQGSSSATTKTTTYRLGKNNLPAGVTKIDFEITDSEGAIVKGSLSVGPQTETISLRVLPHRDLTIVIKVYSGEILSFQGQSTVAALRPGQTYPLNVEADPVATTGTPLLSLNQTPVSVIEGDSGSTFMTFTASLSALANGDVTVTYVTSDGTASSLLNNNNETGNDFANTLGILTIPTSTLSATIGIAVIGDSTTEPDETFTLTLSNASANVTLSGATATGIIISDDYPGRLNDTGVTLCGDYAFLSEIVIDNNDLDCAAVGSTISTNGLDIDGNPVPAGQDAHYGRDATSNNDSDGLAGFSYTKLDASGVPLADQTLSYTAQPWACVQDNYTGLIWEVKTTNGFQNTTSTFTWYNSTGTNDGGYAGTSNGGSCSIPGNCDTEKYVADMNSLNNGTGICGANNWRLPTVAELLSIVNSSRFNPSIDINYFPNIQTDRSYWTSTPLSESSLTTLAWDIDFYYGRADAGNKIGNSQYIRLVHRKIKPL